MAQQKRLHPINTPPLLAASYTVNKLEDTRMTTSTEVRAAVYCGTYAKYNNGSIAGKWLYFGDYDSPREFWNACKELHKDEADPEFMFQDFEGMPREFYKESMWTDDVENIYSWLALSDDQQELIAEYCNATGYGLIDIDDIEELEDKHYCTLDGYNHEKDFGEYLVDNGIVDVPEHLESFIDYESLGRENLYDFSVSENGFVFTN
jgi:antirestriction protein